MIRMDACVLCQKDFDEGVTFVHSLEREHFMEWG